MSCLEIPERFGEGKVLITEIHLGEPGVEMFFRPFHPRGTGRRHYTLLPADYLLAEHELSVLVNSTRYLPGEWWKSFPFRQVDSMETLVWNGNVSHIHRNSYMFGWDDSGNFLYERTKPPSESFLAKLKWGIGVQAISIENGSINPNAINRNAPGDSRTFFGVDPMNNVIWLMVYDKITEEGMNVLAKEAGVFVGAQLDASDASTLIIGKGAKGVVRHTGIRGRRPLAAVFGVRAEPLPSD